MKTKNFLTVLAFAIAIGSAFASQHFGTTGYSRKADVSGQTADCQSRKICTGSTVACEITLTSPNVTVDLFDASTGSCGNLLMQD
jgi:hypothetical protein